MKPPNIGKVYHHAKHTGLHERISIRHKYDNQDLYSSGILSVFLDVLRGSSMVFYVFATCMISSGFILG